MPSAREEEHIAKRGRESDAEKGVFFLGAGKRRQGSLKEISFELGMERSM